MIIISLKWTLSLFKLRRLTSSLALVIITMATSQNPLLVWMTYEIMGRVVPLVCLIHSATVPVLKLIITKACINKACDFFSSVKAEVSLDAKLQTLYCRYRE